MAIDLNGHILQANVSGSVITNNPNNTLTIIDSSPSAVHYFTYSTNSAWTISPSATEYDTTIGGINENTTDGAIIAVYGGCITGGDHGSLGGGIQNHGTLILSSGNIIGNRVSATANIDGVGGAGGVYNMGTMIISGGSIIGNSADMNVGLSGSVPGGGVYNNGTMSISGGAIIGNYSKNEGGGVYNASGKTLNISGGAIVGNHAYQGGGVFNAFDSSSVVNMYGGLISNNSAEEEGGGIYNSGTMTMYGGEISDNITPKKGGGIYYEDGSLFMKDVKITGNKSGEYGGGVYRSNSNIITISGLSVIENNTVFTTSSITTTPSNIHMYSPHSEKLSIEELAMGSSIGITLWDYDYKTTVGAVSNVGKDYADYLFSDDTNYHIEASGAGIALVEGAPLRVKLTTDEHGILSRTNDILAISEANVTSSAGVITIGSIQVVATANNGYEFDKWEVDPSGNKITANTTIKAIFKQSKYTISISAYAGGTVNTTSLTNVVYGTSISSSSNTLTIGSNTITATPNSGYSFKGWGGIGGASTVTANMSIYAEFQQDDPSGDAGSTQVPSVPTYRVSIKNSIGGTARVSNSSAAEGNTIIITITPNKGYDFEEVVVKTVSGKDVTLYTLSSDTMQYHFTMPGEEVVVSASFADDNTMLNYFVDVKATDYYYDAVLWAAKSGITSGTDNLHFEPSAITNRAQMITFLWRLAGSPVVNYAMAFKDVDEDAYYAEAVRWAVSEGITKGTSETTFGPNAKVTRAQSLTFLWRYNGSLAFANMTAEGPAPSPYKDVKTDAYYYNAVLWAKGQQITEGTSETTFSPDQNCTRAQVVTFMYRSEQ